MIIKQSLKACVGVVVLFWMMLGNLSFAEAEIKIPENEKNAEIQFLWSPDGGGELVSLFTEDRPATEDRSNGKLLFCSIDE